MLDIARRLEQAGYSTWCVGGAVRDALLGEAHLDWDLATAATPDQVRALFGARRTIPVGIEFGTVGVLDRDGHLHEVTTFRRDVTTDGRHATVAFGASIDEDLARRDLTINAVAIHPDTHELRDPFGGVGDLKARIIRAVGDPRERMHEDRLRALRALRFAGRLGFAIDAATWDAIVESAPHLTRLSAERVKQELEKTMEQVAKPAAAFGLWQRSGALASLIPPLDRVDPSAFDVLDHLAAPRAGGRPYRKVLRLAGLFASLGSGAAAQAMVGLRFSRADIATVSTLLDRIERIGPDLEEAVLSAGSIDPARVRRMVAAIGRLNVAMVMRLLAARWDAARASGAQRVPAPARVARIYRSMIHSAFHDPVELADLALDGDDLRRGGIPAGPGLGKILHALLARVVEDPSANDPGTLLAIARELHEAVPGAHPGGAGTATSNEP